MYDIKAILWIFSDIKLQLHLSTQNNLIKFIKENTYKQHVHINMELKFVNTYDGKINYFSTILQSWYRYFLD